MEIVIEIGNIVKYDVDAIINAANENLMPGGGVCGAIFNEAGYNELWRECLKIGHCDTGNAVITSGCGLKASYVIHAVGPIYYDDDKSAPLLKSVYESILKVAEDNNLKSIAIPAISTGIYGYPLEKACRIAYDTIKAYQCNILEKIYLVCFDEKTYIEYMKIK